MLFKNAIGRYKKPGGVAVISSPTLATLTLSGTLTNGSSSSGTILGATTASTIVSNVTGLTVNSGARTYSWDGTGAAGATSNGLVETLSGAIGSPKNSSITVAAAAGTALTAATITRTTGVSTYPPQLSFTRPVDWQDGDHAVVQWSLDPTFATGVSETPTPVTLASGTPTYDFGLSAIVSGNYLMRMGAWNAGRPVSLNWSNLQGVGDTVAPTITSTNTISSYANVAGTKAVTADKGVTWAVVGGADQASYGFTSSASPLNYDAPLVAGTRTVQIQATSYFGVTSSIQTITDTVATNVPNAFSFTDVTGATVSTVYTSNTVTLAGSAPGPFAVTITGGTYSKNGGAYTSAAGTASIGDTFAVRVTSSASGSTTVSAVLSVAGITDSYDVQTPVTLSTNTTYDPAAKGAAMTLTNSNRTAARGSGSGWTAVAGTTAKGGTPRYAEFTIGIGSADNISVGLCSTGATMADGLNPGFSGDTSCVAMAGDGGPGYGSAGGASGPSPGGFGYGAGDVIGVYSDPAGNTASWYKNGVLKITLTGLSLGSTYRLVTGSQGPGLNATVNTGQTTFAYSIPGGAVAWDV